MNVSKTPGFLSDKIIRGHRISVLKKAVNDIGNGALIDIVPGVPEGDPDLIRWEQHFTALDEPYAITARPGRVSRRHDGTINALIKLRKAWD